MTDKNPNNTSDQSAQQDPPDSDESMHAHDKGGEWLRDQTGEDHNLSGSSTFRTLPDQPGTGDKSNAQEANERQSKR